MSNTRDFFISFTSDDLQIATTLNDALLSAGYTTWFHPLDLPGGGGIAQWMRHGLDHANQMIAICSSAYFDESKLYSSAEWQSVFWKDPLNQNSLLLLAYVEDCDPPGIIGQLQRIDLIGKQGPEAADELLTFLQTEQARQDLLAALAIDRTRRLPEIFNVQGGINPLFTGRDTELSTLHDRVRSGTATAITAVHGMGGIGKTSLAREYAHRFGTGARFGGVWWVEAETQSGILAAYDQLAERLGNAVPRDADQEKTGAIVRDWLGQQPDSAPWLVIFDNAPDAVTVASWLPKGSAKVIITSRFKTFDTVADMLPLDFWDEETTAKFLQTRTGRGSDDEALSLAKRLDGLPLAAEQAGAYLGENATLSFKAYEDRLIQMLDRAPTDLPGGYDKSLYATFRTALEAVSEREHGEAALGILNLCSFLSPDGVELEILSACAIQTEILPDPPRATLTDEVLCAEAVTALSAYSLIRIDDVLGWGQTLILHRLLGDIARDLMDQEEHAIWATAAVRMISALFPYVDVNSWQLCACLTPHARAFLKLEPGSGAAGKALTYVLNQAAVYLEERGDFDGATILLRRRVEIGEIVHKDDPKVTAIALGNLAGRLAKREATWDEAEASYIRALEIEETVLSPGDPSLAITLSNYGGLHFQRKDFAKAAEVTERAVKIDREAKGQFSDTYATRLNNLSAIYGAWAQATGDSKLYKKERELQIESSQITIATRGMRHPAMTSTQNNLAVMHSNAEDILLAAKHMALSVAIDLSLDQFSHPNTQRHIAHLLHYWIESGESGKVARLESGDLSDLFSIVEQIEAEHREWVAEDPDNRKFGPPSPITGATS